MNVYDFDGTIYKKDSSVELYKFIAKKGPSIVVKCLAGQLGAMIRYKLHRCSKEEMKEVYFSFLKFVSIDEILDEFIDKERKNINEWYMKQKREDDVVISASPEFLVRPFVNKLGIYNVIASDVDKKTGKFNSKNCHGEEKVYRFFELYPDAVIDEFYSDSKSDIYMAMRAKKAFLVNSNEPCEWKIKIR